MFFFLLKRFNELYNSFNPTKQVFDSWVLVMYFFTVQTEQIINEYKIRALACHPDKHLNDPKAGMQTVMSCIIFEKINVKVKVKAYDRLSVFCQS